MINKEFILQELKSIGTEERASKSDVMFPTSMQVLGVRNPDMRILIKELASELRDWDKVELLKLCNALINEKVFDAQLMVYMLLDHLKIVRTLTNAEAKKLKGVQDNWASVDSYGTLIFGLLWRIGTISDEEVFQLQDSEDVWTRRLALVGTVALNLKSRGGKGDAPRTLLACTRAAADHHDMIVKAVSWSLRSLISWNSAAVRNFLDEHHSVLHKRVLREVNHKLDFGTKN